MVTCGDTGLPVLACRAVYDSSFTSLSSPELLLRAREVAVAVAAAAATAWPCRLFGAPIRDSGHGEVSEVIRQISDGEGKQRW